MHKPQTSVYTHKHTLTYSSKHTRQKHTHISFLQAHPTRASGKSTQTHDRQTSHMPREWTCLANVKSDSRQRTIDGQIHDFFSVHLQADGLPYLLNRLDRFQPHEFSPRSLQEKEWQGE